MDLSWLTLTLLCVVVLLLSYVYYMSHTHGLFKKLGIPGPTPWPVLGNFYHEGKEGFSNFHKAAYQKYKNYKAFGIYRGKIPVLIVRDLDMIRDICVKNFSRFVNGTSFDVGEPFDNALTQVKDDQWKNIRTTISPTFNTVRLKRMYGHIENNAKLLVKFLKDKQERNEPLELKEVLSCYTMDVIASTGFGVQINSLEDMDNQFMTEAKGVMGGSGLVILFMFFLNFLSPVLKYFKLSSLPQKHIKFFTRFVDATIENRKNEAGSAPTRNDFLQLMMEAENDSQGNDDNMSEEDAKALGTHSAKRGLSYKEIQAQAFLFILAGYETTSTVLSFTMFLLAMNPECLKKAQDEVDEVLDGKFPDYDNCQSLHYMDMCLNESMRMFPPAPLIDRMCGEDIDLHGVPIKKGLSVTFPVCTIHYDPEIWPEPERFDPERFTQENKNKRHPYAHLPFGQGPRNCIGMRLALLEMKVALAASLQKFTPVKCEKSVYPVEFMQFRVMAKDGLWVKLEERS